MNLKILFMLLLYYGVIILVLATPGTPFSDIDYNASLNDSALTSDEIDSGGLFAVGVSFLRFVALVGFGVGLPSSVPAIIAYTFTVWQSMLTVFSIGWFVSSIWNG